MLFGEDGKNRGKYCRSVTYFFVINTLLQTSYLVRVVSVEVFRRHEWVVEKIWIVTLFRYIHTSFTDTSIIQPKYQFRKRIWTWVNKQHFYDCAVTSPLHFLGHLLGSFTKTQKTGFCTVYEQNMGLERPQLWNVQHASQYLFLRLTASQAFSFKTSLRLFNTLLVDISVSTQHCEELLN